MIIPHLSQSYYLTFIYLVVKMSLMKNRSFSYLVAHFDLECHCAINMAKVSRISQTQGVRELKKLFDQKLASLNRLFMKWYKKDEDFREWIEEAISCSRNNERGSSIVPLLTIESFEQGIGRIVLCLEKIWRKGEYILQIGLWHIVEKSAYTIDWAPDPSLITFVNRLPTNKTHLFCMFLTAFKKPSVAIH